MRLYLAAPLFSAAERDWNEELAAALRNGGHEVFLPQENEAGMDSATIFATDVAGIDQAEALVAIVDGADPDAGTSGKSATPTGRSRSSSSGPTFALNPG